MPTVPNQNSLSSMNSVLKSIENDRQVYLWFLMLISLPDIQQKLSTNSKTKAAYQNLKNIQVAEIITYATLALTIIGPCLIKQPWDLLLGIFPLVILINLFRKNRLCVAGISEAFLLANIQADTLNKQTLYQTCENLSKEYNVPSLVDIITNQDFIERKILLGAIIFLPFIHPFKTWQLLLVILIIFFTTRAIINTSMVLKRLK